MRKKTGDGLTSGKPDSKHQNLHKSLPGRNLTRLLKTLLQHSFETTLLTMVNSESERLRDIVRAKDPMRNLCQERLITPEACDWVKFALDPFHDQQLDNLRGFPDVATEPTVVVKIRQAVTVSAPPGLPDGETWDCHMVLSPIDYAPRSYNVGVKAAPVGQVDGSGNTAYQAAGLITKAVGPDGTLTTVGRLDGLVINSVRGNSEYGVNETFTPGHMPLEGGDGYQVQNINLDNYLDFNETDLGVYRVVYSGFEVVNTTAQIKKQGAVTVYEYGNSFETGVSIPDASTQVGGTTYEYSPTGYYNPTNYFRCPPNTIAEAKIMPGSHSWAAQDGNYNTAKFQTENPFQALTARPWVVCQNQVKAGEGRGYFTPDPFDGTGAPYTAGSIASSPFLAEMKTTYAATAPQAGAPGPCHFSRMNTSGAYYTGLSPETTLFVTWRVGIERLPAANKPAFLALSQPSATFDPNALVLYNMVANVLPPGCPQGYNDAGKWYNWIANAAKQSIPTVYPIVRAASMMAAASGRPLTAQALTGIASQMKPAAEAQAAKRLQAAARKKQAWLHGVPFQMPKKKGAVQNWSKGRGVPGGTNGLR